LKLAAAIDRTRRFTPLLDIIGAHIATASLIEDWIDETERRAWFLFEASRIAHS
jgi:starvation-inducible DNA-binding protein